MFRIEVDEFGVWGATLGVGVQAWPFFFFFVFIPPVCRVRAELVNFDGPCRILGCIQEGPLHVALPTSGPFTADRWASISVHLLQWKLLVLKPSDRKP